MQLGFVYVPAMGNSGEYSGGNSGIITLEDIMEEIIGEISDEYDETEEMDYTKLDEKNFIFEGKTLLNDMYKVLDVSPNVFDEIEGEFDSLAGLILELAGNFPKKEEQIKYQNFLFTVVSVSKKRIMEVKVSLLEQDEIEKTNSND
jgi:putative hemolysin